MENHDLGGRHILVTGAASGIGRAVAAMARARGAKVALLDREPTVNEAARGISGAFAAAADVCDAAAVDRAVAASAAALGGLDGVVNAAGCDLIAPIADLTDAEWGRVIGVNLTGPFHVCRAAEPWLRRAARATIVNVASGAALMPIRHRTAYCAAKAGLVMFSKALAMELAPTIRVNAVCPGIVDTPMFRRSYAEAPDKEAEMKRILDRYLIREVASPEEMAETILFLTSRASSYITGIALAADAGRTFH
jgi:NAD(P)-dependent dehydrogenase (short-subunit alcohol dehydrogenase family)